MKNNVLIIDADSIIFASAVVSDSLDDAFDKIVNKVSYIMKRVSKEFGSVPYVKFCHGSYSNWRKFIAPEYKANRKAEVPPFLSELHRECEFEFDGLRAKGEETDDLVVDLWREETKKGNNVIIAAIDKDFHQVPAKFYDFSKKDRFYELNELDSLNAFYTQMIVGDSADNIKTCKGYGLSKSKKIFEGCTTKYQFVRRTYELYKKIYKSKANLRYIKTYQLLKLGKR